MDENTSLIVVARGDQTGTEINSTKLPAIFSEHVCANVPTSRSFCDQIVEQLPLVHTWGTSHMVSSFKGRDSGALIKIIGAFHNTKVHVTC